VELNIVGEQLLDRGCISSLKDDAAHLIDERDLVETLRHLLGERR